MGFDIKKVGTAVNQKRQFNIDNVGKEVRKKEREQELENAGIVSDPFSARAKEERGLTSTHDKIVTPQSLSREAEALKSRRNELSGKAKAGTLTAGETASYDKSVQKYNDNAAYLNNNLNKDFSAKALDSEHRTIYGGMEEAAKHSSLLPAIPGTSDPKESASSLPGSANGAWWVNPGLQSAADVQAERQAINEDYRALKEKFIRGEATNADFDAFTRRRVAFSKNAPGIFDRELSARIGKNSEYTGAEYGSFENGEISGIAKKSVDELYRKTYEAFLAGQADGTAFDTLAAAVSNYSGKERASILDGLYVTEAERELQAAKRAYSGVLEANKNITYGMPEYDMAQQAKNAAKERVMKAKQKKSAAFNTYTEYKDADDYNRLMREYGYATGAADFAEKSAYKTTKNGKVPKPSATGGYAETGFDDVNYDYINKNADAVNIANANDLANFGLSAAFVGTDKTEMNADEIALYNYLYATEGKAAANAFVDKLKGVLNKRARQSLEASFADYAKEHPVSSSAFSTLIAPVKGFGYIGQAADYAADGKIDQNAPYNKFSFAQKAIRSSVNQTVEKNWGAVGSFAYNTGMSMADFLFTSFVSSGIGVGVAGAEKAAKIASNLSLAIMGSGAAADATIDAKDRGLSDNQSFALGTIAGIAEIVTEKVSIENLFSPNWDENAWRYFIKNVIAEGSEEGASDVINLVADMLISGDQNEWQQSIYKYMDFGYSASEAFGRTAADQFGQIGLDMLGGAVSGGVMAGGRIGFGFGKAAVKTAAEQNNIYRATGKMLRRIGGNNTFDNLAKQAFENGENSKSYEFAAKLQDKAAHGKTITDRELGKLSELSKADIIRSAAARKAASDTADSAKVSENADSEKQGAVREQPEAVTESPESVAENPKTVSESPESVSGQAETKNTVPADAETVNEDSNGNPDISENAAEASGISDDAGEDYALSNEESEELRELEDAEPFPHAEDSEDEVRDRLWEKASGIPSGEEKDSRLFFEAGISEGDIDEEAAGVIRRISALTDLNIYFYREAAENGTISNGYYDASDNSIHVNLRSNDPVSQIISHELTHSLENTKSYKALQKTVFDYISRTEGKTALADERARLAEVYRRNGKAHSNAAEVDADILASFVGRKLLTDENAIRYVVGYHRSLGVWMREQITRLKAALGSKSAKTQAFLDKAARLYHEALMESKNAVRSENSGKKNSIVYLDDGSAYVEANRQVISGNNHDKWISQIKHYFDELLSDSGELDIKTQEGDILTLTKKETKYKAWDSHKTVQGNRVPMDDSEFKVKLRAESHIDELAEASTRNGRKLTPDKKNHTFAINGFSYRTAYFHDFDGKYYKVTISVGHNGTKATVYNVAQIKEDTLPTANILAVNGSKAVGQYPLDHSISETGENVNSSSEKSFSVSENSGKDSKYSVTQNYDFTKSFAEQVDDFINGNHSRDYFIVSGTPEVFQNVGFNALPVTIDKKHVDYLVNGTKNDDHVFSQLTIKDLPNLIKNPIAIFDSSSRPGRVIALVAEKSKSGKQIIVPIEVDASLNSNSLIMDTNLITSSYGHTSAIKQLLNAVSNETSGKTNLYYWNKKEAVALMHNAGLQLPGNLPKDGFIHSIRESGSDVNTKLENVTHSQQFKRWFGDWVNKPYSASKVVDEDGKPLVVYHGTDADFTVFKSNDGNYWFSASEDYAEAMAEERGGNRVMPTYLNMRKPYYAKLKPSQFSDPNFEAPIIREAKSKGYDGAIIENDTSNDLAKDTFYVVFNPTQIKSATDNIGTFDGSNPDIRYSVSEIQGENEDSKANKLQYSISNTRDLNWREQVERYFRQDGSIKSSDSLYLGTSESALSDKGIPAAPLYIPTSIINKATREPKGSKSGHSLTQKDILSLAEGIKNAPIIIHNPARNALIYVTSNQNASGQNIVAIFDLNNNLHGENAHRATSIHGRDSVAAMLKNLGSDSTVFITNENGFNSIAGLQSNITSELLAKVESIEYSISEVGENVNSSSKKGYSVSDTAKAKVDKGQVVINENALAKEESRQLNENAPGEYAHAAEERRDMEHAAVEKSIQEAQERENDPNLIVENGLITEEARRLNEEASWEYDRLLQEEYNKRQVLYNNDEGKSVKREDLKKVDKEYLERNERTLLKKLRKALGVPYGVSRDSLSGMVRTISDEYLEKGNISQKTVDTLFERAYDNGRVIDTDYYDEYKHVKDYFRTKAIGVNDRIKSDFADWNAFRQSTMGTLRLVNISESSPDSGIYTVEDAWRDFSEIAPALANKNISADADMLKALFEIVHGIQKVEYRLSDADTDEQKAWEKRDFENAVYDSIRDFRTVRVRAIETVRADTGFDPEMFANMSEDDKNNIAADLLKASEAAAAAKRSMEKVSRKFLLTGDEEMLVGELLKGKITFAGIDGNRYNLKNIKAVYEARSAYEANAAVLSEYAKKHKAMLIAEADGVLRNMVDTHDKAGINYSTETAERNIRDTFGDNATSEKIIDTYFRPVHKNEAAKTRMMNEYIARVKELKLSNKLSGADKKAGRVSESAAVQILGEAKGNIEFLENQKKRGKALAERDGKTLEGWKGVISDLWMKNPQLDKPKIEAAVTEFRKIYNELIGEINRVRVLNGYPAISYRAGYFPHFSRAESIDGIMDKITAALGGSTEVTELPTEIAGRTGVFKPGIRWFGAALERQGISTDYDALYGFARYLDGAADIIYHTDDIQRLRALASQVRYRTTNESIQAQVDDVRRDRTLDDDAKEEKIKKLYDKGGYALSGFVNWLEEYTNILAGKKSELDRKIESAVGRKFYNFSKAIEGRVGANMVGGNAASALTNFIPITQAGGSVGSLDLLGGMWDTIKSYKTDDGFADRSDFLTNRFGVNALTQTAMQKISSAAGVPMEFIDSFTSNTLVRARYNQNLRSGLSEEAALREADEWAAGLMAGRSKGEMPTIYHSRNLLLKPFTMFQLEVKNQYSYLFKDLPRDFKNRDKNLAKLIAAYFKIFLGAYIFNDLYEKLVGRRSALDPLGIMNDTVGDITGYKLPNVIDGIGDLVSGNAFFDETEKAGNAYEVVGGLVGDVMDELPFIGGVLGGGRTPINSAFPDMEKMGKAIFNNEWSTKKRVNTTLSELGKSVVANVIAPVAGGQIRKIIQGVNAAVSGGSYTMDADGNKILQYPVISENKGELIGNIAKGALFGKSSFETAGDWVDSGFKSFSARDTALYDGLCDSGESEKAAFALISNLRNAEKTDEQSRSAVQRDMIRHSALTGAGKALAYAVIGASEKEQELISALDDAGADMGAVADALMDIKDINGSKALKGAEKSNAKRSVLLQMGLTDEEKHRIYTTVISDSKESEIAEFGAAGMSFDTFLKIQNEYSEIDERDLKASEKATEFSYTIDGMNLNDKQREVAKDCFAYYSMVPAGGKNEDSTWNLKYDRFVSTGIDRDLSLNLTKELDALEPQDGKKTVSAVQKYRVVINSDLTAEEQDAAFQVLMSADEYAKYSRGRRLGVSSTAYVLYKENMSAFDKNGNGSLSNAEIESLIYYISGNGGHPLSGGKNVKFVAMSEAEKAVLWQMMTGSGSLKNNPYRGKQAQRAASEYLRLKNKEKEDKKEN